MAEDVKKWTPDIDENLRCKGATKQGPCLNLAMPDTFYCKIHGGVSATRVLEARERVDHLKALWRDQVRKYKDDPILKSLSMEIGVQRMILEKMLNRCEDDFDLILNAGPIADMIGKIKETVISFDRIEQRMGELLNKTAVRQIAMQLVAIINQEFADQPEKLLSLSDKFNKALNMIGTVDDTDSK